MHAHWARDSTHCGTPVSDLDWELLDWELLDRYLAGDATSAEQEQFERWLAERPERAVQIAGFRQALESLDTDVPAHEREAMWSAIFGQPVESGDQLPAVPPSVEIAAPVHVRSRRPMMLGFAAAAVLAIGVALAGRVWLWGANAGTSATQRVVAVPRGQQAQLRLSDGTEVVLGAGSTLRYPDQFGAGAREVELEGEAYFAVAHDGRHPFRVIAGDLVATDLGTEFLVRAYPEDPRARVVVRSGLVGVRPGGSHHMAQAEQTVRPGELGQMGKDGVPVVTPADTAAYFAWMRGTLVLDGVPLSEALPQLSRWYDLDFRLADSSLGAIPISGSLDRTLTADRLDLLAASLGLRQMRSGRVVTLYRSNGPAR